MKEVDLFSSFIECVVTMLIIVILALYHGWAASWLWEWFVVTKFGLPSMSAVSMAGISLMFGAVRLRPVFKEELMNQGMTTFVMLFGPPFLVAIGSVLRGWV